MLFCEAARGTATGNERSTFHEHHPVHDRDAGPAARDQGGTLDLHADNGQIALREAGLLDEFFRLARPEGQEMRQLDPAGTMLFHHVPEPDERYKPEIDRGLLRDLLLNSLQPGTVRWGQALTAVSGPAEGPRHLHFTDGTTVEADLVIGADGAWSKVRRAVSPATPRYTGMSFLEAWFHDVETRHPDIAELVGQGGAAATTSASTSSSASRPTGSPPAVSRTTASEPSFWSATATGRPPCAG
ncbi:FAD-dependent oxidoreductase [Nonomuraea wenchangensis]|uniref:FAD-dependent oxidoreductase n=1 Tax=Nonomuraea wenchangensis TaxID=568860 RepID=UPI0033DAF067